MEIEQLEWFDIDNLPENIHHVDKKLIKQAILLYKNNNIL